MLVLAIGALGAMGALSRYWVAKSWVLTGFSSYWLTPVINGVGSFLLGYLFSTMSLRGELQSSVYLSLSVGFLGGFTTFSGFSLDFFNLMREQTPQQAFVYLAINIVFCLGVCYLGLLLGSRS